MSRYVPKIPASRGLTVKQQTIDKARADGFKMAMLAAAICLNDIFEMPDDDIQYFMEQTNVLIGSLSEKIDDAKYLIRALEGMTGIEIDFN